MRVPLSEALAAALDPFGLGLAIIDPETLRFTFVNESFASLVGATAEELLTLPSLLAKVAPEEAAAAEACFREARTVHRPLHLVHASGDLVEVDVSTHPFDDYKHASRAVAVVVRAADERLERESLRSAVGEAAGALRARDEFFSMAAHELRGPLTALRLHSQAVIRGLRREDPDLTRVRRGVAEVDRNAEKLNVLAAQFVEVSRVRSGRLLLDRVPMDLAAAVREVATRFGGEAASRRATIIIDGEASLRGEWDPLRIEQVLSNLVSNALRYGEGNPVSVELHSIGSRARLIVRDHGSGLSEEEQARLFEPFERALRHANVNGAGLGLWIVRRLVEAHEGTVHVTSSVGKGTAFFVDLPRQAGTKLEA